MSPWAQFGGLFTNPVGTSTMRRPDIMTNPDPDVSPVIPRGMLDWRGLGTTRGPITADMAARNAERSQIGLDMALGFAGQATPIKAYHGSPHSFDRFDMSKIGTGEGAQAYGHGLYFAGNEGVARSYRDALANPLSGFDDFDMMMKRWSGYPGIQVSPADVREALTGTARLGPLADKPEIVDAIRRLVPDYNPKAAVSGEALNHYRKINDAIEAVSPKGSMYEVALRTSPERLLDWDKPLSQQPAGVRDALAKVGVAPAAAPATMRELHPIRQKIEAAFSGTPVEAMGKTVADDLSLGRGSWDVDAIRKMVGPDGAAKLDAALVDLERLTSPKRPEAWQNLAGADAYRLATDLAPAADGEAFLRALGKSTGRDTAASSALREAGLDGIQYLDAGSRAAGEGSRNYVLFRDDIIDILRKYGVIGMLGGGGVATEATQ